MARGFCCAAFVLLCSVLLSVSVPAQGPSATREVTVTVRVVTTDSGDAIPYARVLYGSPPVSARSGLDGRFRVRVPIDGGLPITISKPGFATVSQLLTARNPVLQMDRAAVISGRVETEEGVPLVGARVQLRQVEDDVEKRTLDGATDDRGEYRFGALTPGDYVVWTTALGPTVIEATTRGFVGGFRQTAIYYPGVSEAHDATPLHVAPGEERTDVILRAPTAASSMTGFNAAGQVPMLVPSPPPELGSGSITGRITAIDGRPLAGAQVVAFSDPRNWAFGTRRERPVTKYTTTDETGAFELSDLRPGEFVVAASMPGWMMTDAPIAFTSERALKALPRLQIADGMRAHVQLSMQPWPVLSGRIVDEVGDAVAGARVEFMGVRYQRGQRRLVSVGTSAVTDDRGMYRLVGTLPGRHVISATVGGLRTGELPGYARTFYPGTAIASQARFVDVVSGEQTGLDFALAEAPTSRVSGQLFNAMGAGDGSGMVELVPSIRSTSATIPYGARIERDGRFEFRNVPPGEYVIRAHQGVRGTAEGQFAAVRVSVGNADVAGLVVRRQLGSELRGQVDFEGEPRDADTPLRVDVEARPVDYEMSPVQFAGATSRGDGTFELAGLTGPRRIEVVKVPDGWTVDAVLANGRNVTDEPVTFGRGQAPVDVEIRMTRRLTRLVGRVADSRGRTQSGAVVAFAVDSRRWYPASRHVRMVEAAGDGQFSLTGLPPGSYYVAATSDWPEDEGWRDPVFLESLRLRATTVTLGEQQRESVILTAR